LYLKPKQMKKLNILMFFIYCTVSVISQGIGINNTGVVPNANTMLDVDSDDKGILIPRLTTVARVTLGGALGLGDNGMLVYDKDLLVFYYWDGAIWVLVGSGTGSDNQNLTGATLTGTSLKIDIENGTSATVDLASLNVPAGAIMAFNLATCPTGWAPANGAGGMPDLRGEFLRGVDDGRGVDVGRVLASSQPEEFKSHLHIVDPPSSFTGSDGSHLHTVDPPSTATSSNGSHRHGPSSGNIFLYGGTTAGNDGTGHYAGNATPSAWGGVGASSVTAFAGAHTHTVDVSAFNSASAGAHTHTVDIAAFNSVTSGGTETRPRNVAFLYCIKE